MEELTYQEAFEKCKGQRLNVINDRNLTIPQKIMKLDELFDEYCEEVNLIRKKKEAEIRKKKEELKEEREEEERKQNGIPKKFY